MTGVQTCALPIYNFLARIFIPEVIIILAKKLLKMSIKLSQVKEYESRTIAIGIIS